MIPFALNRAAHNFASAPALHDALGTWTYEQLLQQSQQVAANLQYHGVQAGDFVALLLPPGREYITLLWAVLGLGAVALPLNSRLPAEGLQLHLNQAGCRFLITLNETKVRFAKVQTIPATPCFMKLTKEKKVIFPDNINQPQAATVVFTSGSTGKPAAALHSYGNHYYSALGSNSNIKLAPGDRWLLSLPLYHVSGLSVLFRTALAGAAISLPAYDLSLAENIHKFLPTHISLVAAQLQPLLQDEQTALLLSKMKAILLGGSAIPNKLIKQAIRLKLPLHVSYGSTEMASQISTSTPSAGLEELLTSGFVLPYRQVQITTEGEVLVKGKTLFSGYLQNGRIVRRLNKAGWFASGDLGFFDKNGRLTIRGRKDRMFISGGENIQPEEIENHLEQLAQVKRAVVLPVPDDRFGRRPAAFVQMVNNAAPDESRLRALLSQRLPACKIPVRFFRWPDEAVPALKIDLKKFKKAAEQLILNTELSS